MRLVTDLHRGRRDLRQDEQCADTIIAAPRRRPIHPRMRAGIHIGQARALRGIGPIISGADAGDAGEGVKNRVGWWWPALIVRAIAVSVDGKHRAGGDWAPSEGCSIQPLTRQDQAGEGREAVRPTTRMRKVDESVEKFVVKARSTECEHRSVPRNKNNASIKQRVGSAAMTRCPVQCRAVTRKYQVG